MSKTCMVPKDLPVTLFQNDSMVKGSDILEAASASSDLHGNPSGTCG